MIYAVCVSNLKVSCSSQLPGTPVGSYLPPFRSSVGKPCLGLKEEAGTHTSKEKDLQASGCFNDPILAAWTGFTDLNGCDPLMQFTPNLDRDRQSHEVAERSLSALYGFVILMFPLRYSPAIQRANKVHSAPQTTVPPLSRDGM